MHDEYDIEKALRQYEHDPDVRTKQEVMSAFERELRRGHGGGGARHGGFWRRPIPLYAAIFVLVFASGLSFLAGQRSSLPWGHPAVSEPTAPARGIITSEDIEWSVAEGDLL